MVSQVFKVIVAQFLWLLNVLVCFTLTLRRQFFRLFRRRRRQLSKADSVNNRNLNFRRADNGRNFLRTCRRLFSAVHLTKRPARRSATWQIRSYATGISQRASPTLYSTLLLSERLYPHLREIDAAAVQRLAAVADRNQATEIINELIYE